MPPKFVGNFTVVKESKFPGQKGQRRKCFLKKIIKLFLKSWNELVESWDELVKIIWDELVKVGRVGIETSWKWYELTSLRFRKTI